MPAEWLSGFTHRPVTNRWRPRRAQYGHPHDAPVRKLLLHTTEGPSVQAALNAYDSRAGRYSSGVHPHLTVDPTTHERLQHIPLTRSAYALKATNRAGIIQVEIRGYARESHLWAHEISDWLGRMVVAPILAACPLIPADAPLAFRGEESGLLAAPWPRGKARVSPTVWSGTYGIVGHQHAPHDGHWDPGRISIRPILEAARTALRDPDTEGLPMSYDVQRDPEVNVTWATWEVAGTTNIRWFGADRPDAVPKPGGAWVLHEQATIVKHNQASNPYL